MVPREMDAAIPIPSCGSRRSSGGDRRSLNPHMGRRRRSGSEGVGVGLREELQAGANGRRARPGREPAQGQRLRQEADVRALRVRKGRRGVSEIRLGFLEGAMRGVV